MCKYRYILHCWVQTDTQESTNRKLIKLGLFTEMV